MTSTHLLIMLLPPALFVAELAMLEVGYRLAGRLPQRVEGKQGPITGTLLSLMILVLAFSFSNASGRLEASRQTILDEVNAIGTVWERVDLAAPAVQPELRDGVRGFLDARIRAHDVVLDVPRYEQEVARGEELLARIWKLAVTGTEPTPTPNRTLLLGAIGAMGDANNARTLSLGTHLPPSVFIFLFAMVLVGTGLIGVSLGAGDRRPWVHWMAIALVLTGVVCTIVDMEFPRQGMFDLLHRADAMLVHLRASMDVRR